MTQNQTVLLRKVGGFYHAFDEDAIILFFLFHYRINNGKSGFPIQSISKVLTTLKEKKINYLVKIDEDQKEEMSFQGENCYGDIYEKGKKEYEEYHKKERVVERIWKLEDKKVDKVIEFVQNL